MDCDVKIENLSTDELKQLRVFIIKENLSPSRGVGTLLFYALIFCAALGLTIAWYWFLIFFSLALLGNVVRSFIGKNALNKINETLENRNV